MMSHGGKRGMYWRRQVFLWIGILFVIISPLENLAASTEEELEENVIINGVAYPIPEAWLGQKLDTPPLKPPALVRIPSELTENQANIYILQKACAALVNMAAKAKEDGVGLVVDSGYRSAWYQRKIFIRLMKKGRTFEDIVRYVAPPGYSQHMLGTVLDFSPGNWRFASTSAYSWLREHAGAYGFTETYPENNQRHPWESWHWRYRDSVE
jgi:D-alanyl-D-alanine carboxypeptidase